MKKLLRGISIAFLLAGLTAILIWVLSLAGCTVARKEVVQHQAGYTSTGQDSGVLDDIPGATGVPVNQDWVNGYDSLLEKYGATLFPPRKKGDRDGITKEGNHFRITDATWERQLVLNQKRADDQ